MGILSFLFEKDNNAHYANLDLIDLNAPRSRFSKVYLAPPRLEYYSPSDVVNGLTNILKEFTSDVGFKNSDHTIELGVAQSVSWSINRRQMPLEFLSGTYVTFIGSASTIGQGIIQNLVIPDSILKNLKDLNVQYSSLLNDVIQLIDALIPDKDNRRIYGSIENISDIPFGLIVELKNASGKTLSRQYFEMCKIVNYSTGLQENNPIMIENISFLFHRVVDF